LGTTLDQLPPLHGLIEVARDFHGRGWMAGTAGNLSVRSAPDRFWITASGKAKGRLGDGDFLEVEVTGDQVLRNPGGDSKPSAETAIHRVVYRLFPEAGACLHVHTVDAVIAAARMPADAAGLPLAPIEMLKGLGVWESQPEVELALFDNLADVAEIAAQIERRFRAHPPRLRGLMIRDHGVTVWGQTLQQAYDRLECLEFILSVMTRSPAWQPD
jgi:methylthioribulose-1-phosphate dehydratase